jgi:hypothetical protein
METFKKNPVHFITLGITLITIVFTGGVTWSRMDHTHIRVDAMDQRVHELSKAVVELQISNAVLHEISQSIKEIRQDLKRRGN